ncbi:hypothetical protein E2C01_011233 [Portunus trituberculatus]|uniref:Uncharacterized protein n=1 Tax=Portunus trituberculatus TaxID=210409 RepID=A0A5B7DAJ2_PORTR|nr:hypothetical protein [Portunus trituberculatus]
MRHVCVLVYGKNLVGVTLMHHRQLVVLVSRLPCYTPPVTPILPSCPSSCLHGILSLEFLPSALNPVPHVHLNLPLSHHLNLNLCSLSLYFLMETSATSLVSLDSLKRRDKARRKTATTEDMLFTNGAEKNGNLGAVSTSDSANIAASGPASLPERVTADRMTVSLGTDRMSTSLEGVLSDEGLLMPPPSSSSSGSLRPVPRVTSAPNPLNEAWQTPMSHQADSANRARLRLTMPTPTAAQTVE